jgi:hypothetical protein
LEESRIFAFKFGSGTIRMAEIRLHYLLKYKRVNLIALCLFIGNIVETQADMGIIEVDFLIKVQVEDIEIDRKWIFYQLQQFEDILLLDVDGGLLHAFRDIDSMVVSKHIGHVDKVDLPLTVFFNIVIHLETLALVYGLTVDLTHPILP